MKGPVPKDGTPARSWLPSRERRLLAMIILIKAILFYYGTRSYQVLENKPLSGFFGWMEIWNRWDSINYLKLAEFGYSATGDTKTLMGFYPVYPWLIRVVAMGSGRYLLSAFVISTVASLVAAILFQRLLLLDYSADLAERAVFFLFIFPTSYFLHIGYSESLFLVMLFGSFLAARSGRWWLAASLGALSCMTRAMGPILIPVLAVEAFLKYRKTRRWQWQWLWIPAIGVGLISYLLLNWYITGNSFAFLAIRRQYFFLEPTWFWVGVGAKIAAMDLSSAEGEMVANQEVLFIFLGLICAIVSWVKLRPSYAAWVTGNWIMFTSLMFILGVPRYTLILFPVFILFAQLATRFIWRVVITVWSLLFLALFAAQFARGAWAF